MKNILLGTACLLFSFSAYSQELKEILKFALNTDPTVEEARANIQISEYQTEISKAGHLPIISLENTSVIKQYHRNNGDRSSGVGVRGKLNLYSWGAIEAEVERDAAKTLYYGNKLLETQELIGKKIFELYLQALSAKDSIEVYQKSADVHHKILSDLEFITFYDPGREFEINEAESRLNQIEATISAQERILAITLSQLSRYTGTTLSAEQLKDPFKDVVTEKFINSFKNNDVKTHPSYQAQKEEMNSTQAAVKASQARRLPAINLEGSASKHEQEIYVNVSWDLYNPAAKYTVEQNQYSNKAAYAKLKEIELDLTEKAQTAELEMLKNQHLISVIDKQIKSQDKVVKDTELKFKIADSTLLQLLNTYQELTTVEISKVTAKNNYRNAALLYLTSQSNIRHWAGISTININKIK